MEIAGLAQHTLITFTLAWSRLIGLFMVAPMFSFSVILMRFRVLAAFTITLCIVPWLGNLVVPTELNLVGIIVLFLKEFTVGVMLGLFLTIVFSILRLTAQLFSIQIGMGIAEIFDSMTNENSSLWGYFFYIIGILIFIELGGLHILIKSITESYELLPVFNFLEKSESLMTHGINYFTRMFLIALKIAFPIIATALILSITLGIIGKMAPQANIFILGIPIQIGLGIVFILITIPFMVVLFSNVINNSINDTIEFLIGNTVKTTLQF